MCYYRCLHVNTIYQSIRNDNIYFTYDCQNYIIEIGAKLHSQQRIQVCVISRQIFQIAF
jgi:hypothetical protein